MRESHKHLFWFLLAATAALWGIKLRAFPSKDPTPTRAVTEPPAALEADAAPPQAPEGIRADP